MAKKQFQPKSLYKIRYDKNSKLWIQVRKRNYLYWYKFLQICLRENYKINKKKYVGWDLDTILDTKFDIWWEKHWKKLFGFECEPKTLKPITKPKFRISGKDHAKIKTQSIRLSLLVHQYRHVGKNFDISEKIQLEETAKRYPTHFHFEQHGHFNRDYISKQIGVLKGRFKKTITNVCNGTFP